MKGEVEALLFSSGSPLSMDFMKKLLDTDKRTLRKTLEELKSDYEKIGGAVYLWNEDEEWKFAVKSKYTEIVSKIVSDVELSFSTMETLAVIAYKNPVLQADVIQVRGTNAYEQISELFELKFIRKEKEGRSYRLYLTEKFFDYFDLEGGKNIREVFKALQEQQKEQLKLKKQKPKIEEEEEIVEESVVAVNRSGEEILSDVDKKLDELSARLEELDEAKKEVTPMESEEDVSAMSEMQEHDELPSERKTEE